MKKQFLFLVFAAGFISTVLWLSACQKDNPITPYDTTATTLQATDRTPGDSKVFPPTSHPYGKSYKEWTTLWMKKFVALNCDENPWLNSGNSKVFYEGGSVYFMAGIAEVGGSADVTVPHGKAILFPLVNFLNDYPCPDPNFHPDPGQSMSDFLTNGTEEFWGAVDLMALVTNQSVSVDGNAVSDPQDYLFTSDLFNFTGSSDLALCFDPCITGGSQPGVGSGDYIMLKPLSKGLHTVHYHIEIPIWGAVQDGTFNITVE